MNEVPPELLDGPSAADRQDAAEQAGGQDRSGRENSRRTRWLLACLLALFVAVVIAASLSGTSGSS